MANPPLLGAAPSIMWLDLSLKEKISVRVDNMGGSAVTVKQMIVLNLVKETLDDYGKNL